MQNFGAYQLSVTFYKLAKRIPAPAHLKVQLQRASSCVALNLAEGSGKQAYPADRKRHFRIALASQRECKAILDLLDCKNPEVEKILDALGGCLYKLSL